MVTLVTPRAENGNLIFTCPACRHETRQPWLRFRQHSPDTIKADHISEYIECVHCSGRLRFYLAEIETFVQTAQSQRPDRGNNVWSKVSGPP